MAYDDSNRIVLMRDIEKALNKIRPCAITTGFHCGSVAEDGTDILMLSENLSVNITLLWRIRSDESSIIIEAVMHDCSLGQYAFSECSNYHREEMVLNNQIENVIFDIVGELAKKITEWLKSPFCAKVVAQ